VSGVRCGGVESHLGYPALLTARVTYNCRETGYDDKGKDNMNTVEILEVSGWAGYGGSVIVRCDWTIGADLAARVGQDRVHLATRVRDASGVYIVENGPRSRPMPLGQWHSEVIVPLALPEQSGLYTVEIDVVVEHRFWASWYGIAPTLFTVAREESGDLTIQVESDSGQGRWEQILTSDGVFRDCPTNYGQEDSERAVEIPWVLSRYRGERNVLDVGYAYAEERYYRARDALCIPVLIGLDRVTRQQAGVTPVIADVRSPPLRRGSMELILVVSTIEHIGRDNTGYLGTRADPQEVRGDMRALRALAMVLAPGGRLMLTVPFGPAENHGWFVQYDALGLDQLVAESDLVVTEAAYYQYRNAWEGPLPQSALMTCRYGIDAVAASGVACLELTRAVAYR